eukprot:Filipodium_phascolosomae@DN2534_c0_g1_i11.p1
MYRYLKSIFPGTYNLNETGTREDIVEQPKPKKKKKTLKNVRAEEYATPQKYLDGAQVPTYYVFQSNMVASEFVKAGMYAQLEVDKRLTVPTRTHIRFLVTATDVIHCFAIPALALKTDATPGRLHRFNFIL